MLFRAGVVQVDRAVSVAPEVVVELGIRQFVRPIFHSSFEGELGFALESLQGKRDLT